MFASAQRLATLTRSRAAQGIRRFSGRADIGRSNQPIIHNEPFLHYKVGSPERIALRESIERMKATVEDIPCIVGGQEVRRGSPVAQTMPSNHQHVLANFYEADEDLAKDAIQASLDAKGKWESMKFDDRAAIFLKVCCFFSFFCLSLSLSLSLSLCLSPSLSISLSLSVCVSCLLSLSVSLYLISVCLSLPLTLASFSFLSLSHSLSSPHFSSPLFLSPPLLT